MTRPSILETVLHVYRYNIGEPDQATAYKQLRAQLKDGRKWMHCLAMGTRLPLQDGPVTLETKFLFSNQWNTGPLPNLPSGARVFDWYEGIYPNKDLKEGHWLEITDEMKQLRRIVLHCGYCGAHYDTPTKDGFCSNCLGSEYLEASEIHLLRLYPVGEWMPKREPLTEDERAQLLPRFKEEQIHATSARDRKRQETTRKRIEADYQKVITENVEHAKTKRDGLLWLMDRGLKTGNWIYYSHTGRFCFGWRKPISHDELPDELTEFPFDYDVTFSDQLG